MVQQLQKLDGAKVILATAPDNKAVSQLINGLCFDGKLVVVAGINGPIQVFGGQLLNGRRNIQGWVASGANVRKDATDAITVQVMAGGLIVFSNNISKLLNVN